MGPREPFGLVEVAADLRSQGTGSRHGHLAPLEVSPEHDPLRPGVDGRRQQFGEGELQVLGRDLVHVLADGTGEHPSGEREGGIGGNGQLEDVHGSLQLSSRRRR